MRFDTEINPSNNFDYVYIEDSNVDSDRVLNSGMIPLFHNTCETVNIFPRDYISIQENYVPQNVLTDGYIIFKNGKTNLVSDNFVITNIKKYSQDGQSVTPLFYKHVIEALIDPYKLKIVDFFGTELPADQYLIGFDNNKTIIYKNKSEIPYFIEYFENNKVHKKFMNLERVFRELSYEDILLGEEGERNTYRINYGSSSSDIAVLEVDYANEMYLSYISEKSLINTPCGNLGTIWPIEVLNISFKHKNEKTGRVKFYKTTDYYFQNFYGYNNSRQVENIKCFKIYKNIVKTQFTIPKNFLENVFVYVYDFLSNVLIGAFSSDKTFINKVKDGISYQEILDVSCDGYISLPLDIEDSHIVYCTQYTDTNYFEYLDLDLSSVQDNNTLIGLYIREYVNDDTPSIGHSVIKSEEDKLLYTANIIENNILDANSEIGVYHLGFISIVPIKEYQKNLVSIQRVGNRTEENKKAEAIKSNFGFFLKELYDENISINLENSLVAIVNTSSKQLPSTALQTIINSTDASTRSFIKEIGN